MANPTTAIATTNDFYNVAKELEAKETKEKEEKRTVATGTKTGTNVYTYPSYGSYGKYNTGKYTTYTPKGMVNENDTVHGFGKSSQKACKDHGPDQGDRPDDRRGCSLRGYPLPDQRGQICLKQGRQGGSGRTYQPLRSGRH